MMALLCGLSSFAQAPALAPTQDPGVSYAVLIDRPEVRIIRVEIQPGAVRRMHTHDDVQFHLFIPLTAGIQLTIGSSKPVEATPGQAYFIEKGTLHGFRNAGTSVAMVTEVFVRQGTPVAKQEVLGFALAMAHTP